MTDIEERFELCRDRRGELALGTELDGAYDDYFKKAACLCVRIEKSYRLAQEGFYEKAPLSELRNDNRELYEELFAENYKGSYANPAYACDRLGLDMGRLLSFLYAELRSMIPCAYVGRLEGMRSRMVLLVEVYGAFECACQDGGLPTAEEIKEIIYWFVSDYSDMAAQWRTQTQVDTKHDFALRIVAESDLSDVRYLYKYGEYVTPEIERVASYLAGLSKERIKLIADTYTEGYRIGFVKGNKDLSKKTTVEIRYVLGFERIVAEAIKNFDAMGLKPTIIRASDSIFYKRGVHKLGYYGADANKQYNYDHKEDLALFLDRRLLNRKLETLTAAYESVKEQARGYAGPAVIETFGEKPFVPVPKQEACVFSAQQQELSAEYARESADITNRYIIGEERSFTIIAFPVPDIGDKFEEIFDETVKLNTLDYKTYERIQATIIAALNKAAYVKIKGMNGNRTDLTVQLYHLENPDRETIFENCVADVNIPGGEVFTTPVLEGTNGRLHVSRVFLEGLEYQNLEIDFADGMVSDYNCSNFASAEENKKYIKTNVLFNHKTLPMGEFAIGTNTTAYMTAKKYGISQLFPILIAEKTGPHFAVGDTCYSRSEDVRVYNEDGKEIVAKDNSVSALRRTDPSKAYFACHTDITIPYDELGSITAYSNDGGECVIIENGRFVLEGTEELNLAFDK